MAELQAHLIMSQELIHLTDHESSIGTVPHGLWQWLDGDSCVSSTARTRLRWARYRIELFWA
jgi:hypothetical protein